VTTMKSTIILDVKPFRRKLLPPSSGSKSYPNNKLARNRLYGVTSQDSILFRKLLDSSFSIWLEPKSPYRRSHSLV
jgi:hypothetical protein